MLARLTRIPGLHGTEMPAFVRTLHKRIRSESGDLEDDEPTDVELVKRSKVVQRQAAAKIDTASQLARKIHPYMIRRGPTSVDNNGNSLINLPTRTSITLRLLQSDSEKKAVDEAITGILLK